jgi:hypothetical protein
MATKAYRNKPNREKRNHTRKEKRDNLREVPSYVWQELAPKPSTYQVATFEAWTR